MSTGLPDTAVIEAQLRQVFGNEISDVALTDDEIRFVYTPPAAADEPPRYGATRVIAFNPWLKEVDGEPYRIPDWLWRKFRQISEGVAGFDPNIMLTPVVPRGNKVIKLMVDYSAFPLWDMGDPERPGRMIKPEALPLSQELVGRLQSWADMYDNAGPFGEWGPGEHARFRAEAPQLATQLQRELGPDYEIFDFHTEAAKRYR